MKIYMVGGAVRDRLLGLPVQDHDWVVVGATPEQMISAGYTPVGRDFPVFLHPQTHEEYALARTERVRTGVWAKLLINAVRILRHKDLRPPLQDPGQRGARLNPSLALRAGRTNHRGDSA